MLYVCNTMFQQLKAERFTQLHVVEEMLLLGWVQLATAAQIKLEPFVPGRCFFGLSQCPG